jgi:hypothetical protein
LVLGYFIINLPQKGLFLSLTLRQTRAAVYCDLECSVVNTLKPRIEKMKTNIAPSMITTFTTEVLALPSNECLIFKTKSTKMLRKRARPFIVLKIKSQKAFSTYKKGARVFDRGRVAAGDVGRDVGHVARHVSGAERPVERRHGKVRRDVAARTKPNILVKFRFFYSFIFNFLFL